MITLAPPDRTRPLRLTPRSAGDLAMILVLASPTVAPLLTGDASVLANRFVTGLAKQNSGAIHPSLVGAYLAVAIAAASTTLRNPRATWQLIRSRAIYMVFTLAALTSTLWSIAPGRTLQRSLVLVLWTLFAGRLVRVYGRRQRLESILAWAGWSVLAASVILTLVEPSLAIVAHRGGLAWRGFFEHKNEFGVTLALLSPFVIHAARTQLQRIAIVALMIASLLAAQAVLPLIALGGVATVMGNKLGIGRLARRSVVGLAALLVVAFLLDGGVLNALFSSVGRDATLTGRAAIWQASGEYALRRPLSGYGYEAFFSSPLRVDLSTSLDLNVPHPHSLIVASVLDLGVVGLILPAAVLRHARGSVSAAPRSGSPWPGCLVALSIISLGETSLLYGGGLAWVLLICAPTLAGRRC